jgi:hypothetical protein
MSIVYYPLPAIGVSRGPPRYAMYEPNMSKEEYIDEEYPEDEEFYPEEEIAGCENGECYRTLGGEEYDPEIMELSNEMA